MSDQNFKVPDEVEKMLKSGKDLSELAKQLCEQLGEMERKIREASRASSCRESNARIEETTSHARSLVRSPRQDSSRDQELREQLEKDDIGSETKRRWKNISSAD